MDIYLFLQVMDKNNKYMRFDNLTCYVISQIPSIKTVQLVKTIYFLELEYKIKFGINLTEVPIIRLPMGPVSSSYKYHFNRLEKTGQIILKKMGKGTAYFSNHVFKFEQIELKIFKPVIDYISRIISEFPNDATDIIKGKSYQTFPMVRLAEREKQDNKIHLNWKILENPFFTEGDIDPLARERKSVLAHQLKTPAGNENDALAALDVYKEFYTFCDEIINI